MQGDIITKNFNAFLINGSFTIKDAMEQMSSIGYKTLFIVDIDTKKLIGSLSEGDIRKWILRNESLTECVEKIYNRNPKFVSEQYEIERVKDLMIDYVIECIPVINSSGEIVDILKWEEMFSRDKKNKNLLKSPVVIMAGGKGTRLDPLTKILPKPLIPLGDKPVIEVIMDSFYEHGIDMFFLSICHKSKMIKSYFEDSNCKYKIEYVEENTPLGTVGGLRKLNIGKEQYPIFVTNCDIIMKCDYSDILAFHTKNSFDFTLIVSCKTFEIPYGICKIENGGHLQSILEKPTYEFLVNTGMYIFEQKIIDLIPSDMHMDIPELIRIVQEKGYSIGVFPISEDAWIDVGQWGEYHKALEKMKI